MAITGGDGPTSRPCARWRRVGLAVAAAVLVLGGAAAQPAAADYSPYVLVDGLLSVPDDPLPVAPGDRLTVTNDPQGPCLPDGQETTLTWIVGAVDPDYTYGDELTFVSTALTGEVTTTDGNWSVEIVLPADLPDGRYGISASCIGEPPPVPPGEPPADGLLFDYLPSFIQIGPGSTTTTSSTPPTSTSTSVAAPPPTTPPTTPPAAVPVAAAADYTG